MDDEGQHDMAERLRAGTFPGDEEFAFYTRALGGAVLVTPLEEPHTVPCIYGEGPVRCEMGFVYSVDGAGNSAGHYVLLQSWAPQTEPCEDPDGADTPAGRPAAKPAYATSLDGSDLDEEKTASSPHSTLNESSPLKPFV